jgi:hypothetical protein
VKGEAKAKLTADLFKSGIDHAEASVSPLKNSPNSVPLTAGQLAALQQGVMDRAGQVLLLAWPVQAVALYCNPSSWQSLCGTHARHIAQTVNGLLNASGDS